MSSLGRARMARLPWLVVLLWPSLAVGLVRDARATTALAGLGSLHEVATVANESEPASLPLEDQLNALAAQCSELCKKLGEIADALPDDSTALDEVKEVEGEACKSVPYFQEEGLSDEEIEKRLQEGRNRSADWKGALESAVEELRNEALRRASQTADGGVTVVTNMSPVSPVSSLEAVLSTMPAGGGSVAMKK
mmetsp:Transcript_42863/g.98312  ORF Transcript_42863/g.98312 Transcript_42863/m.98312 type:complete len:194 (-) Transcript_42863:62-643(-)